MILITGGERVVLLTLKVRARVLLSQHCKRF